MNNILLLSAGRRVELLKAFNESLQRLKIDGTVYTADMYPELSAACQFSQHYFSF